MAAFIAAMAMAATMAAPVMMNANAGTVTIGNYDTADEATHTYIAYKIFSGTAEPSTFGEAELKSISFANKTKEDDFIKYLTGVGVDSADEDESAKVFKHSTDFAGCDTIAKIADKLKDYTGSTNATKAKDFAAWAVANKDLLSKVGTSATSTLSLTEDGYYVIEEQALTGDNSANGSRTAYLLGVYDSANESITIAPKTSMPSVVKKVEEDDKDVTWAGKDDTENPVTTNPYGGNFNDTADYGISEDVPFKLIATLPSELDKYDHYYLNFKDHLDAGFVSPANSAFEIKVGTGDAITVNVGAFGAESEGVYTATGTSGNITITVKRTDATGATDIDVQIMDVKSNAYTGVAANGTVTVTYSAKLDTDAVIGKVGNYNDVYLEYSNNPNNTGDGTTAPRDEDKGKTKKDGVVVFTYELDVLKFDGADGKTSRTVADVLAGADFVLSNSDGKYLKIDATTGEYSWYNSTGVSDLDLTTTDSVTRFT